MCPILALIFNTIFNIYKRKYLPPPSFSLNSNTFSIEKILKLFLEPFKVRNALRDLHRLSLITQQ